MTLTKEITTADLVNQLRAKGYSYKDIGAFVDTHWRTIYRWGRGEPHPHGSCNLINHALKSLLAGTQLSYRGM